MYHDINNTKMNLKIKDQTGILSKCKSYTNRQHYSYRLIPSKRTKLIKQNNCLIKLHTYAKIRLERNEDHQGVTQ